MCTCRLIPKTPVIFSFDELLYKKNDIYYSKSLHCIKQDHIIVPSEGVKDNRVIAVDGFWVVWGEAHVAHLHLVTRDPMMHHGEARIKGTPP